MRDYLPVLAVLGGLVLWLCGLWPGRVGPLTLTLGLPPPAGTVERARSPGPRALLQPRAGTAHLEHALACAPAQLTVEVTQPLGARRGLDAVAVGWAGQDDGWGVVSRDSPATAFDLRGRGLVAGSTLQLSSLGGLFDGAGTVEVTPTCAD